MVTMRLTRDWSLWDFMIAPLTAVFKFYWWLFGILGAVLLTVVGEAVAELLLDTYRTDKQYPLFPKRI